MHQLTSALRLCTCSPLPHPNPCPFVKSVPLLPQLDSDNPLVGLTCWSLRTHRQLNCDVKRDGARQLVLEFSNMWIDLSEMKTTIRRVYRQYHLVVTPDPSRQPRWSSKLSVALVWELSLHSLSLSGSLEETCIYIQASELMTSIPSAYWCMQSLPVGALRTLFRPYP